MKISCSIRILLLSFFFLSYPQVLNGIEPDFFSKDTSSPYNVTPVVNVIISGSDHAHVQDVLSKAVSLSRKVPIRNVVIFTPGSGLREFEYMGHDDSPPDSGTAKRESRNPFVQYFRALRLSSIQTKAGNGLLERLRISYSPTWVVRYEGEDYVYEGYPDISRLFTRNGRFTPEN